MPGAINTASLSDGRREVGLGVIGVIGNIRLQGYVREHMLKVKGRELYGEFPVFRHRYVACLFAHDDADGIRHLTHSECCAMA